MVKFILCVFFVFSISFCGAQNIFFVSSDGSDLSEGGIGSPFASIGRAVLEARKVTGGTVVYVRGGDYRFSEPLIFSAIDGGDNRSLVIKPYPGERVIIKGSVKFSDLEWHSYRDGIFMANIDGEPVMDMLIVNGEIRHQARYPNFDADAVRFNGTSADATGERRVKSWKRPAGGYLHAMHLHDWGDFHYVITGKDSDGNLSLVGGWQNNRPLGIHKSNRMVENIFEELDVAGEWFYDTAGKVLYYFPLPDEDIHSSTFESPQLKSLVEFRGTSVQPVKNISIEGFDFTHTVRTFMEKYEQLLLSDWSIYRGGAIFVEGSENCTVNDCNFYNLGGNAVFFNFYNRNCEITGSHFSNIGASAVCFVGDTASVRMPRTNIGKFNVGDANFDWNKGPKTENFPAYCKVYNNLIHHTGIFEKQTAGVQISMSMHITVGSNSIYDLPRAGINIGEGTWGGHVLEFNDVFNTVRETGDHGSFNSWGRDRYWQEDGKITDSLVMYGGYDKLILADAVNTTIIRNNRFRCDRGWDIDLDDGSSNYHIYNNLCLNGGIKLREGFYRVVENNIIINNALHRHVWYHGNGNIFTRNIVTAPYPPRIGSVNEHSLIDFNIFTDSVILKSAQADNLDAHSTVAAVKFVDPANGDFSIDDACREIFRTGFQNFDMHRFGVYSPRLKAIAEKPHFPTTLNSSGVSTGKTVTWKGILVKNLETPGERSATGMDSERGVYVVSASGATGELQGKIRENDVILGLNGSETNSIDDLIKVDSAAGNKKQYEIIVFRNQRKIKITK
jgi:hypothetical protein